MARIGAWIALILCLAGGAALATQAMAGAESPAVAAAAEGSLQPSLQSVAALRPGGETTDAGLGVYPALRDPERLFFPSPEAVEAARAFAQGRRGRVAFAVGDSHGGVDGVAVDRRYRSASLIKAMLLVAYLKQLAATRHALRPADAEQLAVMIRVSDNYSAGQVFRRLAPGALQRLARETGMTSFGVGGDWAEAEVTAADQVRFFLALDRLLPANRRAFALGLLSHVVSFQSWGIPQASRPGWRTYFKGGWRPQEGAQLVHQAALLRRGSRQLAIAVLSDHDPTERYGHQTIKGIAARLLARPRAAGPKPGVLAPIESLRGYSAPKGNTLKPLGQPRA